MKTLVRAAIYARISSDQAGSGLGVQRQLEDCRKLVAEQGWVVEEEYVDNDRSAYSGRVRPEYRRMLADVQDGAVNAVVAWHPDRLYRRLDDLAEFAEVCKSHSIAVRTVQTGHVDLSTPSGRMIAGMLGITARFESEHKAERIKRKMLENAESGLPHGGSARPFGYTDDRVTVIESEAVIIRTLVKRLLAGESLRSLARWLDETGVKTVTGKDWRTPTLRAMLCSERIAGLRGHHGEAVATAVWKPIITVKERDRVLAHFQARKASGRRPPRTYLLTGALRCGKCGVRLYSSPREKSRRYVCLSGPDHHGCGRLTVVAQPVEDLITDAVLYRLDTPELADALAGRTDGDEHAAALAAELIADQDQLTELAELWSAKKINAREWMTARNPIEARIKDAQRRQARVSEHGALAGLVGQGAQLRAQWETLSLSRQVAIVHAVLDHAVIKAGVSGARALDPDRVEPLWKL
jgi:site-specific DNA recombinase